MNITPYELMDVFGRGVTSGESSIMPSRHLPAMYAHDVPEMIGRLLYWISRHDIRALTDDEQLHVDYLIEYLSFEIAPTVKRKLNEVEAHRIENLMQVTPQQAAIISRLLNDLAQEDLWWLNSDGLVQSARYWKARSLMKK